MYRRRRGLIDASSKRQAEGYMYQNGPDVPSTNNGRSRTKITSTGGRRARWQNRPKVSLTCILAQLTKRNQGSRIRKAVRNGRGATKAELLRSRRILK